MSIITLFIKKLKSFLFGFIRSKVTWKIITAGAVLLVVELSQIVTQTLKDLNQFFLDKVYDIEGWLFSTVNDIFSEFEGLLDSFSSAVESVLNALLPEKFKIILQLINFAAWLGMLINTITTSIKNSVETIILGTVNPILLLTGDIEAALDRLALEIDKIEAAITETAAQLHEELANELNTAQTTWNGTIDSIVADILAAFDWYNEGVNAIDQAAQDQILMIEAHNETVRTVINGIMADLATGIALGSRSTEPTGTEETGTTGTGITEPSRSGTTGGSGTTGTGTGGCTLEEIETTLLTIPQISTDPIATMDYDQYRVSLLSDRSLQFSPTLPTVSLSILPAQDCITEMQSNLDNIETDVFAIPAAIQSDFEANFPTLFRQHLTDEVKGIIILFLTRLILEKKNEILEAIDTLKNDVGAKKATWETAFSDKVSEVLTGIDSKVTAFMDALVDSIRPSLEKYIDQIVEKIEKAQEEIDDGDVAVLDFIPDWQAVENVMNTLPPVNPSGTIPPPSREMKNRGGVHQPKRRKGLWREQSRKPRNFRGTSTAPLSIQNDPTISDSDVMSIQDVHRILCNHFSRTERLAILFTLAPEDIRINTMDITEMILSLGD